MYGLLLIVYMSLVALLAYLVKFFPEPVMNQSVEFSPLAMLIIFLGLIFPACEAYMFPEFLRIHFFPYTFPGIFERFSRVIAGALVLYATFRGLAVWAMLFLFGVRIIAVGLVFYYIF